MERNHELLEQKRYHLLKLIISINTINSHIIWRNLSIIELASEVKTFLKPIKSSVCVNGTWNVTEVDNLQKASIIHVGNLEKISSIVIYDTQGKIVKEFEPANLQEIEIDLSNENKGMYLLYVGNSIQKIIIK